MKKQFTKLIVNPIGFVAIITMVLMIGFNVMAEGNQAPVLKEAALFNDSSPLTKIMSDRRVITEAAPICPPRCDKPGKPY